MFLDFLNDAISKAKTELEKSVDTALGIDKSADRNSPGGRQQQQEQAAADTGHASIDQHPHVSTHAGEQPSNPASNGQASPNEAQAQLVQGAAAPSGLPPAPPKTKKIVKKIIKRVVKQPASSASDGTNANNAPSNAAPKAGVVEAASTATAGTAANAVTTSAGGGVLEAEVSEVVTERSSVASTQASALLDAAQADQQTAPENSTLHQPASTEGHATASATGTGTTEQAENGITGAANGAEASPSQQQPVENGNHVELGADGWSHDLNLLPSQASQDTASVDIVPDIRTVSRQPTSKQKGDEGGTHADSSISQAQEGIMPVGSLGQQQGEVAHTDSDVASPGSRRSSEGGCHHSLPSITVPGDIRHLDPDGLTTLFQQLQSGLEARDRALQHHAKKNHHLQELVAQLQAKNEALALKTARISEHDWEDMRKEFEQRLAAAERKVYALTKERDALKRGTEKLSDYGALIKEKDGIIKQVMEEGERLSARQGELELALKKLRGQVRELETERDKLTSKLSSEEATSEGLRRAKAKLERDLTAAQEASAAELEAARVQANEMVTRAKAEQTEAEERAREAASMGLQRKLRDAESRGEALSETVVELREALDRQRQAADLREEMLKQDLADLERRCQAAELRHQELTSKLPDATRPLLRQIEAMQAAADAQADAWSAAEQSLASRIQDAEARAAAAAERERHASERAQVLQSRLVGLEAALSTARAEVKSLTEELDRSSQVQAHLREQLAEAQQALSLEQEHCKLVRQQLQQAEDKAGHVLASERAARVAAETDVASLQREHERRVQDLEAQLSEARSAGFSGSMSRGGMEPPAMAAPGYRWVLAKEGETSIAGASSHDDLNAAGRSRVTGDQVLPKSQSKSELANDLLYSLKPTTSGGLPLGPEMESMRATLRIRTSEVASLEGQVRALEVTRDRLSEELVLAAQKAEEAAGAVAASEQLRAELNELQERYVAAVELLGERDEQLDELRADLADVKHMYKEQIEYMVAMLKPAAGSAALAMLPKQ